MHALPALRLGVWSFLDGALGEIADTKVVWRCVILLLRAARSLAGEMHLVLVYQMHLSKGRAKCAIIPFAP